MTNSLQLSDVLILNPKMSVSTFDDASQVAKILCEIPDNEGNSNRVTVPKSLFSILQRLSEKCQLEELKGIYEQSEFKSISWDKFESFVYQYCLPNKVLVRANETDFHAEPKQRAKTMQLQFKLLNKETVNFVAKGLTPFYHSYLLFISTLIFIALQLLFYIRYEPYVAFSFSSIDPTDGLKTVGLVILGMFIHEFGHVTAAYKNGCRNMSIGMGWYLYFFVFYAELSESWRLSRKQRVLVDAGGMYFQGLYMSMLVLIYSQTYSVAIFYCMLILGISFIWNLNPFLKMDGYWIVSDWLGISNLRSEASGELKILASRILGKKLHRTTSLSQKARKYLTIYSVLSNLFFVGLVYVLSQRLSFNLTTELPSRIGLLLDGFSEGFKAWDMIFSLIIILFHCLIVLVILRLLFRASKSLLDWAYPQIKVFIQK